MLPQNFYNEQVCIVLAFWLVFVVLATILSLISWWVCLSSAYVCQVFRHFGAFGGDMRIQQIYAFLTYSQVFLIISLWSNGCYTRTRELVEMSVQLFNTANHADPGQALGEIVAEQCEDQL